MPSVACFVKMDARFTTDENIYTVCLSQTERSLLTFVSFQKHSVKKIRVDIYSVATRLKE